MAKLVIGNNKQVATGAIVREVSPEHYLEYDVDINGKLIHSTTASKIINLNGVTDLSDRVLQWAYKDNTNISGPVDLSGLTTISGAYGLYQGFKGCTGITSVDLSGLTTISGNYGLQRSFEDCTSLTTADLSNLTTISGNYGCAGLFIGCSSLVSADLGNLATVSSSTTPLDSMFKDCTNLTYVNLSSLTTLSSGANNSVAGNMFENCTSLPRIDFPSLKTITGGGSSGANTFLYAFRGCTNLEIANLSALESCAGGCSYMFSGCTKLKKLDLKNLKELPSRYMGFLWACDGCTALETQKFESLNKIIPYNGVAMFKNCTSLQSVWFYALAPDSFGTYWTGQFNKMLTGCTGVTVHFPIRIQATIGSWSDVTAGFDGTNTTVLFDLVTSLTGADSNTYTRQEKDSTSTATAWTYNDTLYYTSGVSDNDHGVNEPTVGATIYSDAACTTAVTTISSIA